jgi:hypothetical protein
MANRHTLLHLQPADDLLRISLISDQRLDSLPDLITETGLGFLTTPCQGQIVNTLRAITLQAPIPAKFRLIVSGSRPTISAISA